MAAPAELYPNKTGGVWMEPCDTADDAESLAPTKRFPYRWFFVWELWDGHFGWTDDDHDPPGEIISMWDPSQRKWRRRGTGL